MQPGDVVMLKSGGPRMTLTSVRHGENGAIASCKWFDELGQLHTERFAAPALVAVHEPHIVAPAL